MTNLKQFYQCNQILKQNYNYNNCILIIEICPVKIINLFVNIIKYTHIKHKHFTNIAFSICIPNVVVFKTVYTFEHIIFCLIKKYYMMFSYPKLSATENLISEFPFSIQNYSCLVTLILKDQLSASRHKTKQKSQDTATQN